VNGNRDIYVFFSSNLSQGRPTNRSCPLFSSLLFSSLLLFCLLFSSHIFSSSLFLSCLLLSSLLFTSLYLLFSSLLLFCLHVCSSSLLSCCVSCRVARLTLAANITEKPLKRVDIMDDIMFKQVGNQAGASGSHSGGRLRFGLPGTQYENILFVTSGDNHNSTLPQDLWGLGSKIFAINRDGAPFSGNVISPPRGDPRIFMYGLRNVQGIAMRPGTEQVYTLTPNPNPNPNPNPRYTLRSTDQTTVMKLPNL
jgi:hypothetical protein